MTKNQIEYQKLQQQKFKDDADIRTALQIAKETNRHNLVSEGEQERHNYATELNNSITTAINSSRANEEARHNAVNESHQQAVLAETNRANLAAESIGYTNAQSNAINAATGRANVEVNRMNAETNAYNATTRVNEMLTQRESLDSQKKLNKAREDLAKAQSNQLGIQNTAFNTGLGWAKSLSETIRNITNTVKLFKE